VEFIWPLMLWALALAPLLWWGHRILGRRQQRAAGQFAEARLFDQLVVRPAGRQRSLPAACYLIALLLLAVAMARPVAALPIPVNRAAVVIAVDTSKSMIATDAQPTRLEAARRAAQALAEIVPRSTRLGLVAFSEYGTVLLPPGTDRTLSSRRWTVSSHSRPPRWEAVSWRRCGCCRAVQARRATARLSWFPGPS